MVQDGPRLSKKQKLRWQFLRRDECLYQIAQVSTAKEEVAAAKSKEESLETERAAVVAEGAEYEGVLEKEWAVLKACEWDATISAVAPFSFAQLKWPLVATLGDSMVKFERCQIYADLGWSWMFHVSAFPSLETTRPAAWMGRSGANGPSTSTSSWRCWSLRASIAPWRVHCPLPLRRNRLSAAPLQRRPGCAGLLGWRWANDME